MRKGAPSLNPKGRPRTGQSLAEAFREHFSPETMIELAEELTRSEDDRVRMAALAFIADRAWGKAVQEVTLSSSSTARSYDELDEGEVRRRLALVRGAQPEASESDADTPVITEVTP